MTNKKSTHREKILIIAGFALAIIMISISAYLIGLLGSNISQFLSAEDGLTKEGVINFDFEAYEALGL